MSTWGWISRSKENVALKLYLTHAEKVSAIVEHAVEALKAYSSRNAEKLDEEWRAVFNLEREADDIKRKILEELSRGLIHPIDREEVVRLVITSDDIASKAKAWTRRLKYAFGEGVSFELVERILEMASEVLRATRLIVEASRGLLEDDRTRVLKIADDIERLEEKVDEIRAEILGKVLSYCRDASVPACILVKEIVDIIEDAADDCEDVADVLRSVVLLR